MDKSIKKQGLMNIIAASIAIIYVLFVTIAFLTGGFNNSGSGSEAAGYIIIIIVLLLPIIVTLAGLIAFSVYLMVTGILFVKSPVYGTKTKKLTIISIIFKILSVVFYAFNIFVLIAANRVLYCILPIISAIFNIFTLYYDLKNLKQDINSNIA